MAYDFASNTDETAPLLTQGAKTGYDSGTKTSGSIDALDDDQVSPARDDFMQNPHFIIWGCLAIAIIVLDHGDSMSARYNLFFMQSWALQVIFVLCGIYLGMLREGVGKALLCLPAYFVVGVLINVLAYAIRDPVVLNRNVWNVIFQFWLVLGLVGYSVLMLPIRNYLRDMRDINSAGRDADSPTDGHSASQVSSRSFVARLVEMRRSWHTSDSAFGVIVISIGLAFVWVAMSRGMATVVDGALALHIDVVLQKMGNGMAYWVGDTQTALKSICASAELSLSNVWLAVSVPLMFPSQQGLTVWLMVLNLHFRRLAIWYSGIGQKFWHGFDLMLIGLVAYHLGMKWRGAVGQKLTRYWFVWVATCGAVWKPGTEERLDLWNSEPFYLRWRMMVIDLILLVVWLSASERLIDGRMLTKEKCKRVARLALCLFWVHQMIFILVPAPFNWLVILSMVGISCIGIASSDDSVASRT